MAFAGGQHLTAALLNSVLGTTVGDTQDTTGNRAATTYSATLSAGSACGVVFIAPASGAVLVHNTALLENSTTGRSHCSVRIGTGGTIGSGTPFLVAADENGIAMQSGDAADDATLSKTLLVTGLTPGATYNAQQQFRATAGSCIVTWRRLVVEPAT